MLCLQILLRTAKKDIHEKWYFEFSNGIVVNKLFPVSAVKTNVNQHHVKFAQSVDLSILALSLSLKSSVAP